MSRLRLLRRKIGVLYWKYNGKIKTWWYFRKKNWRRFGAWIRGWFCSCRKNAENLQNAQCLVVCAHPDDETLYFSSVLKREKPFVVCMSGRGSKCRSTEFDAALSKQGVSGMLLNMPDVPYMAWAWKVFAPLRLHSLSKNCGKVNKIYTHSRSGESHHPHHYATGRAVDRIFRDCKILKTAAASDEHHEKLADADCKEKLSVLRECYPSQIKMLETWYPWWQTYLHTEHFEE